jgi:23S rRNA-/tRNA-specific pseudouridylate synthase
VCLISLLNVKFLLFASLVSSSSEGTLCHSSYRVLASSAPSVSSSAFSLLELQPHSGRKRQLRLHCHVQLGCTILGEKLEMLGVSSSLAAAWKSKTAKEEDALRQALSWTPQRSLPLCLHAHELRLKHPSLNSGSVLCVRAPLPQPFEQLCWHLFGWTMQNAAL